MFVVFGTPDGAVAHVPHLPPGQPNLMAPGERGRGREASLAGHVAPLIRHVASRRHVGPLVGSSLSHVGPFVGFSLRKVVPLIRYLIIFFLEFCFGSFRRELFASFSVRSFSWFEAQL